MASIHITQFGGIAPIGETRNSPKTTAQKAHNCLLWDGSLRPMPQWIEEYFDDSDKVGYIIEDTITGRIVKGIGFAQSVYLTGEPFRKGVVVGMCNSANDGTNSIGVAAPFAMRGVPAGLPTPNTASASIGYTATLESQKPVNRLIAMTYCRKTESGVEESPIFVFPNQTPYGVMFEGDIVNISVILDISEVQLYGVTHVRLYRSISGLDSGEQVANELDTDWHLLRTIAVSNTISFNDGGASTTDPLDLYLAKHFYAPFFYAKFFGLTESGWFYMVSEDGRITFSERYLTHAWPTENELRIPETITSVVCDGDNLYIGTHTQPYIVAVQAGEGEQGLQGSARAFGERLPCLPDTMVAVPGGAVYASRTGLVGLSKNGVKVITAGIINAGDDLRRADSIRTRIDNTPGAIYWNGKYISLPTPAQIDTSLWGGLS